MTSSTCCSQFLRGRSGEGFQSAAGGVLVWASIDSCSACKAGVFSGRRQMWPNNIIRTTETPNLISESYWFSSDEHFYAVSPKLNDMCFSRHILSKIQSAPERHHSFITNNIWSRLFLCCKFRYQQLYKGINLAAFGAILGIEETKFLGVILTSLILLKKLIFKSNFKMFVIYFLF